jgi:hypothetical protein
MRWFFFFALYFILIPATVYLSQGLTPYGLAGILLCGYSLAFAIGMGFKKRRFPRRQNSLIYND